MKTISKLVTAAAAFVISASCLSTAQAQEATLRAVSFIRTDDVWGQRFVELIKKINENGAGQIQIRLLGGPETINAFELGNAIKNGIVDIGMLPGGFYQGIFPASQALSISSKSPVEHRRNGAWDYLNKLHNERANAYFLANYGYGVPMHLYLTKPIDSANLSGLKLRTVPIYRPLIEKLGATTLQTPHAEVFTALERGVVDGYGWSLWGLKSQGFLPVTKFRVEPGFYAGNVSVLVNLNKWNSLTDAQKKILNDTAIAFEKEFETFSVQQSKQELAWQDEAGVKPIKLNASESDRFLSAAKEAGWADVKAKAPNEYENLRRLME